MVCTLIQSLVFYNPYLPAHFFNLLSFKVVSNSNPPKTVANPILDACVNGKMFLVIFDKFERKKERKKERNV